MKARRLSRRTDGLVEGAGAAPGPLWAPLLAFVLPAALLGGLLDGGYPLGLASDWCFYAVLTIGFYLVFSVSGQFSFATAGLFGLGAYASAWASGSAGFLGGVLTGVVLVGLAGGAVAWCFRRADHYTFAIATLAVSESLVLTFRDHLWFTAPGGDLTGIRTPQVAGLVLDDARSVYFLALVGLVTAIAVVGAVERSPLHGRLVAVREEATVATTLGIDVVAARVGAFAVAGGLAGLAGALYAHRPPGVISPGSFGIDLAVTVFLALLLGGKSNLWGSVVGAAFVVWVPAYLRNAGPWREVIYGALLVVAVLALPNGLVGVFSWVRRAVGGRSGVPGGRAGADEGAGPVPAADLRDRTTDPSGPRLAVEGVSVRFGGVAAVSDVSLTLAAGQVLGIVGPNGSGKSTLLNAISGVVPRDGVVRVAGSTLPAGSAAAAKRAGVARSFQTPQVFPTLTVERNVALADADPTGSGVVGALLLRRSMRVADRARLDRVRGALARVGLAGLEHQAAGSLTYGQRKLLELARLEVADAAVMLLDEPTAGLTEAETKAVATIIRDLARRGAALVVVDHKADLLTELCDSILVLATGAVVTEGEPAAVWADPRVVEAYLGEAVAS